MDFFKTVEEFVQFSGGSHPIRKILIANNGIGAIKAIRSIRRWSFDTFGNERTIKFVVMATPQDMKANCEYIRMADEVVDVPGGSNNNNYANINLICEIAESCKVDAVMPMWGHASENPNLPGNLSKITSRKIAFIGPPAAPMQALGDKIGSTIIAQAAGVPTIAWNGDGLTVDYKTLGCIPDDVFAKANVTSAEEALACSERIGYPVMIKASEGGGGKGIRKVHQSSEVANAFRQVQGEIPGSPIFIMRMASNARHLEVQLLADQHGEAIALSGRDCSVQRRHQKIIEEGPPIAAPPSVFRRMEQAACSLAKTVGYANCGTVEFLYMEDTQDFAFLELNPRLQVEHPVTENILGLNLPCCQVQVAMGVPLHRIMDVRKLYGRHVCGKDTIDFTYAERACPPRHCLAVRVTAENPDAGFQPTSGNIEELHFRSAIDVWGYFSVNSSGNIHEFADSQFGHIFASGPDRESARRAMVVALKELEIRGGIRTTVEYITQMIQSDDFMHNRITTDWLDGRIANHKQLMVEEAQYSLAEQLVVLSGAALQGFNYFDTKGTEFKSLLQIGQVPNQDTLVQVVPIDLIYNDTKYMTTCSLSGPLSVIVTCNGESQTIKVRKLADNGYLMVIDGQSHVAYIKKEVAAGTFCIVLDGHTCIFTPEYDPTKLFSTVAGKIARTLVSDGAHLKQGEAFVEVEVMKMFMPLRTAESGVVHFQKSDGAVLAPGDIIATMTLDYPDRVTLATPFIGSLLTPARKQEEADANLKSHVLMRNALGKLELVLSGYPLEAAEITNAFNDYVWAFKDKLRPVYESEEALSVLRGRIDSSLMDSLQQANSQYMDAVMASVNIEYPAGSQLSRLNDHLATLAPENRQGFLTVTGPLWLIIEQYLFDVNTRLLASCIRFTETYLNVEKPFDSMSFTDVVSGIRKDNPDDLESILAMCRSHVNLKAKNHLIICVMEEIKGMSASVVNANAMRPKLPAGITVRNEVSCRNLKIKLADLSKLQQSVYSHVSLNANLLLMEQKSMPIEKRRQRLNDAIISALSTGDPIGVEGDRVAEINKFIDSNVTIRDLFLDSLQQDREYQLAAVEIYLRKLYHKTHYFENVSAGESLSVGAIDGNVWMMYDFKGRGESFFNVGGDGARSRSGSNAPMPVEGFDRRVGVFAVVQNVVDMAALVPSIVAKFPTKGGSNDSDVNALHIVCIHGPPVASNDELSKVLSDMLQPHKAILKAHKVRRVSIIMGPSTGPSVSNTPRRSESFSTLSKMIGACASVASTPSSTGAVGTIFTFRSSSAYKEDRLFRHIEAPYAYHLDLPRLRNYDIQLEEGMQTLSGNVHMYRATPLVGKANTRYFLRLLSFSADIAAAENEALFVEALDSLGLAISTANAASVASSGRHKSSDIGAQANHIFLNVVAPDAVVVPDTFETELRRICTKYSLKLRRLAIADVEVKVICKLSADSPSVMLRFIVSNPTGFVMKVDQYQEVPAVDKTGDYSTTVFKSMGASKGDFDGTPASAPYEVTHKFAKERAEAMASSDTLYAHDWPILFSHAADLQWSQFLKEKVVKAGMAAPQKPKDLFTCQELVLCDSVTGSPLTKGWTASQGEMATLTPIMREPGCNDVGMVAWLMTIRTPECGSYPGTSGRQIVVICNDITVEAGSFGTREDMVFFKASQYARNHGLPRLYLAANSGARIGVAASIKKKFKVCFLDPNDPTKGFKYIYLTKEDHDEAMREHRAANASSDKTAQVPAPVICGAPVMVDGEERHVITDIIGAEPDLGVENLMGSGLIAGETSRAYDDIFTLTLVVGRTVGIGAYLVRLGQRTIQKMRHSPIILTGYQALNKLMGREIYTSNDQLGGPMIMYPNGVSHLLGEDHLDVVTKALQWLSFVPAVRGQSVPIRDITGTEMADRAITYMPPKGAFDPRYMLCGSPLHYEPRTSSESWQSGFFDRNSFVESLSGWAKTVVVGRARLGGIPMGVIVTENRTAEATKPADPADMTSQERMVQQAGGVWFPDSAYKTAQALKDFNREGLPCIVFANWRGFSGGQRDMFDEVLKFGSMIVDALVAYQQPLFVYIPPFAELRGGAWVVVDHTINKNVMEFYAADEARGGVLEAAGIQAIKFREKDLVLTAHRLDLKLVEMDAKLAEMKKTTDADKNEFASLVEQISKREKSLLGVYQQIAMHFCDLHDTPGRMKAKGVIRKQVRWSESRAFFYWRLRRLLCEFQVVDEIAELDPTVKARRAEVTLELRDFYLVQCASTGTVSPVAAAERWESDRNMMGWYAENKAIVTEFVVAQKEAILHHRLTSTVNELLALGGADKGETAAQTHARAVKVLASSLAVIPDELKKDLAKAWH